MNGSLDRHVARAKEKRARWDEARHEGVRSDIEERFAAHARRRSVVVLARSGLVGVALLALAVRAFGGVPHDSSAEMEVSAVGPHAAYDDGGFRGDVARD